MKKNTYILIFVLLFLFQFAYALENTYPKILSYEITNKSEFVDYVSYAFAFLISISSVILIVVIMMAGIDFILAGGDVGKVSHAKKRIKDGFIGLLIVLFSYIILNTINPGIVIENPDLEKCVGGGVVITIEKPDENPKRMCIWETKSKLIIDGTIKEDSTEWTFENGDLKEAWAFSEYDFKGTATLLFQDNDEYPTPIDRDISEALHVPVNTKSIVILRKYPGLYLYDNNNLLIKENPPFFINQTYSDLGDFKDKAVSYTFVQDRDNVNSHYEAILFEDVNFSGGCALLERSYSGDIRSIIHEMYFKDKETSSVILYKMDETDKESKVILYNKPNCSVEEYNEENVCEGIVTDWEGVYIIPGGTYCGSFKGSVSSVEIKGQIGFVVRSTDNYCMYFDLSGNQNNNCFNLENTRVFYESGYNPETGESIPIRPDHFMVFSIKK